MPIYTYRCGNCGAQLDQQQKFSDDPIALCPVCGQEQLQRVYKPVGIVFKGNGFYATDSRSASKSINGAKSEEKASKDTDTTKKSSDTSTKESKESTSKTETKAAEKA